MSAMTTAPIDHAESAVSRPPTPRTFRQRAAALISAAVAAGLGLLPHILHHVGPLAGAALLAGTAGTLLFGAIGLIAAIPFLLRVHRRCGNWRVPAALLATFAVTFTLSALVIAPAVSGSGAGSGKPTTTQTTPGAPTDDSHAAHHQ